MKSLKRKPLYRDNFNKKKHWKLYKDSVLYFIFVHICLIERNKIVGSKGKTKIIEQIHGEILFNF